MTKLNRYALRSAVEKIDGYYLPRPHERNKTDAFERAKHDCLASLRKQIQKIESITFEQFTSKDSRK